MTREQWVLAVDGWHRYYPDRIGPALPVACWIERRLPQGATNAQIALECGVTRNAVWMKRRHRPKLFGLKDA